jgi:hypothetical protein
LLWAANTAAGVVLILLAFDPTRDLRPVFVLLAVAVGEAARLEILAVASGVPAGATALLLPAPGIRFR